MVEFLGVVEWIAEKASVVVVGNIESIASTCNGKILSTYRERIFDREYHLHEPEIDAMETVLSNVIKGEEVSIDPGAVIREYTATRDKNLRTLRRIGLELIDLQRSLKDSDELEIVNRRELTQTIVALIVEKYSRGKDIAHFLGGTPWLSDDSPVAAFLKEYSLPNSIVFTLDPFVQFVENRSVQRTAILEALGIVKLSPVRESLAMLFWWWTMTLENMKERWTIVYDHILAAPQVEISLKEIVEFLYRTYRISVKVVGWLSFDEVESKVSSRIGDLAEHYSPEYIESAISEIEFGLSTAPDKESMFSVLSMLKEIVSAKMQMSLLNDFDESIRSGNYYQASKRFAEPNFPISQREEFVTAVFDSEISPDHFRAIGDIISRHGNSAAATLIKEKICSAPIEKAEANVRERVRLLCDPQET